MLESKQSSLGWTEEGRNNKLGGPKWPDWDPFFDPKIHPKKFMWVPFCLLSEEMRHKHFFWRPKSGANKSMLELVCVFLPHLENEHFSSLMYMTMTATSKSYCKISCFQVQVTIK